MEHPPENSITPNWDHTQYSSYLHKAGLVWSFPVELLKVYLLEFTFVLLTHSQMTS